MRHLENIWRVEELAWSTGFTTTVHNCPTSSAHYEAMMGQTITSVTYYTDKGMFSIPLSKEVYVPVKFNCTFNVENASVVNVNVAVISAYLCFLSDTVNVYLPILALSFL